MRELIAAVELALDPQVWSRLAIPSQSFIGVDAVTLSAYAAMRSHLKAATWHDGMSITC